jgi:hypothetical protein
MLSLGRSLSNEFVERIARAAFPELEGAPTRELARSMGDVRDAFDGLPVATLRQADRKRLERALLALVSPR